MAWFSGEEDLARARRFIYAGNKAFHEADFPGAHTGYLEAFQILITIDSSVEHKVKEQVRCGNNLTLVLFKLKQYRDAKDICETVLQVAPPQDEGRLKALRSLCRICAAMPDPEPEDFETAEKAFLEVFKLGTAAQKAEAEAELEKLRNRRQLAQSVPSKTLLTQLLASNQTADGGEGVVTRPRAQTKNGRSSVHELDEKKAAEIGAQLAQNHLAESLILEAVQPADSSGVVVTPKPAKKKKKSAEQSHEQSSPPVTEPEAGNRAFGGDLATNCPVAESEPTAVPKKKGKNKHKKKKKNGADGMPGGGVVLPESDQVRLYVADESEQLSEQQSEAGSSLEAWKTRHALEHGQPEGPQQIHKCPNRFHILGVYLVLVLLVLVLLPYKSDYKAPLDHAIVSLFAMDIGSNSDQGSTVCGRNSSCHECAFEDLSTTAWEAPASLCATGSNCIFLSTRWPLELSSPAANSTSGADPCLDVQRGELQHSSFHFYDQGNYSITASTDGHPPVAHLGHPEATQYAADLSICVAAGIVFGLILFYLIANRTVSWLCPKYAAALRANTIGSTVAAQPADNQPPSGFKTTSQPANDGTAALLDCTDVPEETAAVEPVSARLMSLDTFRGLSLAIMIFANKGGGGYWFFNHSAWNGLTLADLVFPWFCWIMGTSMALSFAKAKRRGTRCCDQMMAVSKRTAMLLCIGLFLNLTSGSQKLSDLRVPGVLQYLAVAYWVVSVIVLLVPTWGPSSLDIALMEKQAPEVNKTLTDIGYSPNQLSFSKRALRDVKPYLFQWMVVISIGLLQIALTLFLPVPGCPTGYLGAGGLAEGSNHAQCTGGASTYIDNQIFGKSHTYHHASCGDVYKCNGHDNDHDPEGFLGALNAVVLCWLGHQAGRILLAYKTAAGYDTGRVLVRWLCWGLLCGLIAGGLCGFKQDDGFIPINKNLWSSSFIFAMSSGAFIVLSALFMIIDRWQIWKGGPVSFLGMNSIIIYVGSETFDKFPFGFPHYEGQFVSGNAGVGHEQLIADGGLAVGSWLMLSYFLYANDTFFSL